MRWRPPVGAAVLILLATTAWMASGCDRGGAPASDAAAQEVASTGAWPAPVTVSLPPAPDRAARVWLQEAGRPIEDAILAALVSRAAEHRLVLLGESTHGTEEFYTSRAELTRRLVAEHGFRFVAVEGDWSALRLLDRYVAGEEGAGASAREIMGTFTRWPVWMWANEPFADLMEWLREHNAGLPADERVRVHGVDVYDAGASGRAVESHFAGTEHAPVYPCMSRFWDHRQAYGQVLRRGQPSCEEEVAAAVTALSEPDGALRLALDTEAERFDALFNARVVQAAEAHYRAMAVGGGADSWNSRAGFFFQAVHGLLEAYGADSRGVFWAHNTHVGDARATDMAQRGEVNIGQQARQRLGDEAVFVIGYAKRDGAVVAGERWGAEPRVMPIPPPREGSWDAVLDAVPHTPPWAVVFRGTEPPDALRESRLQRAIGVMFAPERGGGAWVQTRLADRYDALIVYGTTLPLRAIPPVAGP